MGRSGCLCLFAQAHGNFNFQREGRKKKLQIHYVSFYQAETLWSVGQHSLTVIYLAIVAYCTGLQMIPTFYRKRRHKRWNSGLRNLDSGLNYITHFVLLTNTDAAVAIGNEAKYTVFNRFECKFATFRQIFLEGLYRDACDIFEHRMLTIFTNLRTTESCRVNWLHFLRSSRHRSGNDWQQKIAGVKATALHLRSCVNKYTRDTAVIWALARKNLTKPQFSKTGSIAGLCSTSLCFCRTTFLETAR